MVFGLFSSGLIKLQTVFFPLNAVLIIGREDNISVSYPFFILSLLVCLLSGTLLKLSKNEEF